MPKKKKPVKFVRGNEDAKSSELQNFGAFLPESSWAPWALGSRLTRGVLDHNIPSFLCTLLT